MRTRALLVVVAAAAGLAAGPTAGLAAGPTAALANSADAAAAQTYAQADYALVRVAAAHLAISEAAPLAVLSHVRRACPRAAAGSPQDAESTQLSDEVIGAMVIGAGRPDLRATRAFIRTVAGLRWSDPGLTKAVRAYAGELKTLLSLSAPNLCGDVKAWAASGFHTLSASTVAFVGKFMPAWVGLGYLPAQLARYESSATRALARRANRLEAQLSEGEARAVEHWGDIMNALVLNP
jgi:hypothetical protein